MVSTAFDISTSFACLGTGTVIGRHRILRRLAVGGMAEIYLATTSGIEGFEKRVALKRILPQFASIPEFVGMFLDEARLAARLHHPNIAQVYDIGSDGESYFFTMEYVDGRDVRHLRKALRARGQHMPHEHAIALSMGVAAGLHAAHETRGPDGALLQVVHRDVSPANILLGFDGSVKLIDFGIARSERRQTRTRVGVLKGKTCHMSPEQCLGEPLDRRSDVFSLGILLYELTTDSRLFAAETEYESMRLLVDGVVPPPALRRPGYPTALEDIVLRALELDPADRYQTCAEVFVDLERFARVHGLRVDPFSLAAWLGELCPRPEAAVEDGADAPPLFLVPDRDLPGLRLGSVDIEISGDDEDGSFDRMATVERGDLALAPARVVSPRAPSPDSDSARDRKATVSLHARDDSPLGSLAGERASTPGGAGRAFSDSEMEVTRDRMDPPTALIGLDPTIKRRAVPARRRLTALASVLGAASAGAAAVWLAVHLAGGSAGKAAAAESEPVTEPVVEASAATGSSPAAMPAAVPTLVDTAPGPVPPPAATTTTTTSPSTVEPAVKAEARAKEPPVKTRRKSRKARRVEPAEAAPANAMPEAELPAPEMVAPAEPPAAPPKLVDLPARSID